MLAPGEVATSAFPGTNVPAALTAVRVGHQEGFDRVVFEFRTGDEAPGFRVAYQALPVHSDPSDEVVAVGGDHALVVSMQAASRADLSGETAELVYQGPSTVAGTGGAIADVNVAGDFESLLRWAIGVNGSHPFRAFPLQDPPRIVVDLAT